jgi:UDP-GlcNAc:undecaprenyl-phosphate GlcNAc-1-phosphate transferase
MGDTGAMFLGLMLAAAAVTLTGSLDQNALRGPDLFPALLLPLLLPFAVLAVPFVDLLLAVVRRARAGVSPFAPDKAHLHHRLLGLGHSYGRVVLIMYAWSALLAGTAVSVAVTRGPIVVLAVAGGLAVLLLLVSTLPAARLLGRLGR